MRNDEALKGRLKVRSIPLLTVGLTGRDQAPGVTVDQSPCFPRYCDRALVAVLRGLNGRLSGAFVLAPALTPRCDPRLAGAPSRSRPFEFPTSNLRLHIAQYPHFHGGPLEICDQAAIRRFFWAQSGTRLLRPKGVPLARSIAGAEGSDSLGPLFEPAHTTRTFPRVSSTMSATCSKGTSMANRVSIRLSNGGVEPGLIRVAGRPAHHTVPLGTDSIRPLQRIIAKNPEHHPRPISPDRAQCSAAPLAHPYG